MHWQRPGRAFVVLHPALAHVNGMSFLGLPPEKFPTARKEWASFAACLTKIRASGFVFMLRDGERAALNRAACRDWQGYGALFDGGLNDAIMDLGRVIHMMIRGEHVRTSHPVMHATALRLVGGANFGLKRLKAFNADWHRNVADRTARIHGLLRAEGGDEPGTWPQLTEGGFESAAGRMEWLVNADQLVAEGILMSHCVGGYASLCLQGISHIAAVHGADGSRSTVELQIVPRKSGAQEGPLELVQNMSKFNKRADGDAARVVVDFLAASRETEFKVVLGRPGNRHSHGTMSLSAAARAAILAEYAAIAPPEITRASADELRAVVDRYVDRGRDPGDYETAQGNTFLTDGYL
jgi:hypothetical protein